MPIIVADEGALSPRDNLKPAFNQPSNRRRREG
jgi:hypothetical protein